MELICMNNQDDDMKYPPESKVKHHHSFYNEAMKKIKENPKLAFGIGTAGVVGIVGMVTAPPVVITAAPKLAGYAMMGTFAISAQSVY